MGDLLLQAAYPTDVKLGSQQVSKIFSGTEQVWPRVVVGAGYGRLYNWYAMNNAKKLYMPGWHVPTSAETAALSTALGGNSVAGGKMKETGLTNWNSPNTGANNSSGFTGRGSGARDSDASFFGLKQEASYWTANDQGYGNGLTYILLNYLASFNPSAETVPYCSGRSVRFIKDNSTLTTYTDFEGNIYQTIKVGNIVIMAENLRTTNYRDGTEIPNISGSSPWISDTEGAWCYYNNDPAYL